MARTAGEPSLSREAGNDHDRSRERGDQSARCHARSLVQVRRRRRPGRARGYGQRRRGDRRGEKDGGKDECSDAAPFLPAVSCDCGSMSDHDPSGLHFEDSITMITSPLCAMREPDVYIARPCVLVARRQAVRGVASTVAVVGRPYIHPTTTPYAMWPSRLPTRSAVSPREKNPTPTSGVNTICATTNTSTP